VNFNPNAGSNITNSTNPKAKTYPIDADEAKLKHYQMLYVAEQVKKEKAELRAQTAEQRAEVAERRVRELEGVLRNLDTDTDAMNHEDGGTSSMLMEMLEEGMAGVE